MLGAIDEVSEEVGVLVVSGEHAVGLLIERKGGQQRVLPQRERHRAVEGALDIVDLGLQKGVGHVR